MTASTQRVPSLIDTNWSAFVLMITLLSMLNAALVLFLSLPDSARTILTIVNVSISLILYADFFYLLRRSPNRRRFLFDQRGWMVLVGSLPFLRLVRIAWFWWTLRREGETLRKYLLRVTIIRNAQGTLLFVVLIVTIVFEFASVAILGFEAPASNSNINTVSDALWWAATTVATVGYGDRYPVTDAGRITAVLLMAVGIALFTVVTGSLVEWFRDNPMAVLPSDISNDETNFAYQSIELRKLSEQQEIFQQTITELVAKLADLERKLDRQ
ncbi:MAG: potassium channel family protein [Anaerolineae bacterium]|nr:potassium channel family protein [Anaerolineae bacterium]MCB0200241.1 potassium channel family protein [Anaerolineae bacterium]MCB0203569.1 potassium channel family protein [Anaerolineae bacterium]MCB0255448.1 potassium channel family protein [Anaerolineae bacterium]